MPALPSSLALTTIVDGTQIIAVDHRNNYTSLQTFANALLTALSGGTPGQYLTALSPSAIAWGAAPAPVSYRKTTQKTVNSTVTETDLLNGEITIAAGAMGTNLVASLSAAGDLLNNTGSTVVPPRIKLKLGGTVLLDSNVAATGWGTHGTRSIWRIGANIRNLTATTQWVEMWGTFSHGVAVWSPTNVTAAVGLGTGIAVVSGGGGVGQFALMEIANSGAVDTSSARLLELTVTLPVNNSACEMRLNHALVQVL